MQYTRQLRGTGEVVTVRIIELAGKMGKPEANLSNI